jgi:hypothetical protein
MMRMLCIEEESWDSEEEEEEEEEWDAVDPNVFI